VSKIISNRGAGMENDFTGAHDRKFGKWLPSWEGLFKVVKIVLGNSYFMETLEGQKLTKALNGKYLKKYHPSV
jgi:hypothetical protein